MTYIKVKNNMAYGDLYSSNDVDLSDDEILLPVTEYLPQFDLIYQYLSDPIFTILSDFVEVRYTVTNNVAIYPVLITNRLTDFARERDIDVQEIGMLLNCSNPAWVQEAQHFMQLYTQTWEAFYNSTSTDWLEIEAQLPQLTWT